MERTRRLRAIWSWLPAFRAVAEAQHLPTASAALRVSPSALSRMVRLLEEEMGRALFLREGRAIKLNPDGEIFLGAVRDAMRRLDDGLEDLAGSRHRGVVRISAPARIARALAAALAELAQGHPALVPDVKGASSDDVQGQLLRGALDVAITDGDPVHPRLITERLGALSTSVYAAPGHAIFDDAASGAHAFVAPPPRDDGTAADGWPGHRARKVTTWSADLALSLELATRGTHLVVLCDLDAEPHVRAGTLLRHDARLPPLRLFGLRRPPLGDGPGPVEAVLEAFVRALS